ncbi:MAG: hypothetical protein AAFP19_14775, partial [Bacteroidota bacterium]
FSPSSKTSLNFETWQKNEQVAFEQLQHLTFSRQDEFFKDFDVLLDHLSKNNSIYLSEAQTLKDRIKQFQSTEQTWLALLSVLDDRAWFRKLSEYGLKPQHRKYCVLARIGISNKEAGKLLGIKTGTVESIRTELGKKFGKPTKELNNFLLTIEDQT